MNDLILETNRLSFNAYNRTFKIFLKRGNSLVAENVRLEVRYSYPNKTQHTEYEDNHFKQNYFIGFVEDESDSSVLCYFESVPLNSTSKPLVYAQIRIGSNNNKTQYYYVEPMFNNHNTYIVYRSDDIESDIISNGVFK